MILLFVDRIQHDNTGFGAGWFLDRVCIYLILTLYECSLGGGGYYDLVVAASTDTSSFS